MLVIVKKEVFKRLRPCPKCGTKDKIDISHCNYSSFNYSTGKCHNCGFELSWPCGFGEIKELITDWNKLVNLPMLIKEREKKIKKLQKEISELKIIPTKRRYRKVEFLKDKPKKNG